jgi:hypothetical protein
MRFTFLNLTALQIFALNLFLIGQSDPGMVLQHRVISNQLIPGELASVTLELGVKEGFKIAKKPPPVLQLASNPNFEVKSPVLFQETRAGKDPEYFGELKPLDISVLTKMETPPKQYELVGKLTYIYCSEKDKYCGRSATNIKIPVIVVNK